jgi:hypothetical protein
MSSHGELVDTLDDCKPASGYDFLVMQIGITNDGYTPVSTQMPIVSELQLMESSMIPLPLLGWDWRMLATSRFLK